LDIETLFQSIGGTFVTPAPRIAEKLLSIRAFLFDWDGVFNSGTKGEGLASPYSEPDSMGTNLMRFGQWLLHGAVPMTGIITALNNPTGFQLAKREHFNSVYFGFKHKTEALNHLLEAHRLQPAEVAFVFDDAIDLSAARLCGLRFFVSRPASPLLQRFVAQHGLADYMSGNTGGNHAVREICELILGLQGQYDKVLAARMAFQGDFATYMAERNEVVTQFFTPAEGRVTRAMIS
jgi:3-deoxy-D-manno-octulosonate 8-phosphate phosphatase (KDO 8-P phosphatase)